MKSDIAIDFKNVFERYEIEVKTDALVIREYLEALQDVSFSISKGESVAVIGPNGAGKSTLLRLIAGLLRPEKGEVKISGRVGSLLDLGAGFHPELTGRDNLRLNASLYNFGRQELEAKYEEIIKFADIGKFIDVPVRCYSQGMYVRLAFSLAIHIDPDILLIDDCLSVGDDNFRIKSLDKALEFKALGKTIIFVTHDFGLARQMCDRGIYLRQGRILKDAEIGQVIASYVSPMHVDKATFKYLGAKIAEQEESRRMEEEKWRREVAERRQADEQAWQRATLDRRRQDEDAWRLMVSEKRKADEESWGKAVAAARMAEDARWSQETADRRRDDERVWLQSVEERRRREEESWRQEDEERRRQESEKIKTQQELWGQGLAARRQADEEAWQRTTAERRRVQEDIWRREDEERRLQESTRMARQRAQEQEERHRRRQEQQKRVHLISFGRDLELAISSEKVRLLHQGKDLFANDGMRAVFMANGTDVDSSSAVCRVRKISEDKILCLLKWPAHLGVSQIWCFKISSDSSIDVEMTMRSCKGLPIENDRVEFCLQVPVDILDRDRLGNKSSGFCCPDPAGVRLETVQNNHICWIQEDGGRQEHGRATFLTVPDDGDVASQRRSRRRLYFKGRIHQGAGLSQEIAHVPCSHTLEAGSIRSVFEEGSLHFFEDGRQLTAGMGLYTSVYARGLWCDSRQARWKIESFSRDMLIVRGFWPWIPMSQVWCIGMGEKDVVSLECKMILRRAILMSMRETVLMLSEQYGSWQTAHALPEPFPEYFTTNDSFRMCLSSHQADGMTGMSAFSQTLADVAFVPAFMKDHVNIVENSAHIYNVRSRLFHCLHIHQKEEMLLQPGEYEFFKGTVRINGRDRA